MYHPVSLQTYQVWVVWVPILCLRGLTKENLSLYDIG